MRGESQAGRRWWFGTSLVSLALVLAGSPLIARAQDFRPLVQGGPPPDFSLPDPAGREVRLSDFKGKAILLSFWSCYTDTCFASLGAYNALVERLGPRGLAAPTVCQEIPPALAENRYAGLLKRCSAGQTILIDTERRVGRLYFVTEFPTTVVIGPDFTIRELLVGVAPLREAAFAARLEQLVGAVDPGPAPSR